MRPSRAALLVALPVLLAACGSGGTDGTTTAAPTPAGSAASAAAASVTPSAAPSTVSAGPSPTPTVTVLPQSALRPVAGATYKVVGSDTVPADLAGAGDLLRGIVTRALVREGRVVGTVQLMRFSADIPAAELVDGERQVVAEFVAGAPTIEQPVAGRTALVAKDVRANKLGVVAVLDGPDLLLVTARDVQNALFIANRYYA